MDFPTIPVFSPVQRKRRELSQFSPEQLEYLDMLSRFTGRQSYREHVRIEDNPSQKEVVVKEYFNYLGVDEQVKWNDMKRGFQKDQEKALMTGIGVFTGLMGYFLFTTANTKSLGIQAVKSGCAAITAGLIGYKIYQAQYHKELHKFYILTIDRVKDRRRKVLDE